MHEGFDLYRERGARALWDRCLGFFRLDLEQTMALQEARLQRQLVLLNQSEIGRRLSGGAAPASTDEFRSHVPLTTYDDYLDTLGQKREEILPAPAAAWVRTSGRSKNQPKLVPATAELFDEGEWLWLGMALAASADADGELRIREGSRVLNMTAPPPYASGTFFSTVENIWPFRMLPPNKPEVDALPFEERMGLAFNMAVNEGVDIVCSQASVLAAIGEGFQDRRPPGSPFRRLKQPRAFARMGRAALRARAAGRRIYPRDAWGVRGIISGGMDSSLFRERIREYWGRYPLDILVSTEGTFVATQNWDRTSMTLVPNLNFLEFIPEDQLAAEREQRGYEPRTVLMDELAPDRNYEMVITNFFGGSMVRYRTGDILRVTGLSNPTTGTQLPQVVHFARRTDLLEVAGFVTLTEQSVWRAIEEAGIPYEDWSIRKEVEGSDPMLHLRIELKPGSELPADEVRNRVHRQLALIEPDWKDMGEMAGISPLRVTRLPTGSFQRYRDRKVSEGADLGQLKPQHMNATDEAIAALIEAAESAAAEPVRRA